MHVAKRSGLPASLLTWAFGQSHGACGSSGSSSCAALLATDSIAACARVALQRHSPLPPLLQKGALCAHWQQQGQQHDGDSTAHPSGCGAAPGGPESNTAWPHAAAVSGDSTAAPGSSSSSSSSSLVGQLLPLPQPLGLPCLPPRARALLPLATVTATSALASSLAANCSVPGAPGGAGGVRCMSFLPSVRSIRNSFEGEGRQLVNLIMAMNAAVYAYSLLDRSIVRYMALYPPLVLVHGEYYRLLASGFLHTGLLHLGANMLTLHWLGSDLERACGRTRTAIIYLGAVLAGGFMQCYMGPMAMSYGASGGTFGVLAAYAYYRFRNRAFTGFGSHDVSWLAQVAALNAGLWLLSGSNIGHMAHLGGALGGLMLMHLVGPRYRYEHGSLVDRPIVPWFRDSR